MLRLKRTTVTKQEIDEKITIFSDIQDWFLVEKLSQNFKSASIHNPEGFYMGYLNSNGLLRIIPEGIKGNVTIKDNTLVSTDRHFDWNVPTELKKAVQLAWLLLQKPVEAQT